MIPEFIPHFLIMVIINVVFLDGSVVKSSPASARDAGWIPVRKIWRRKWQLQYSCLENPMDRGALWAIVQRVTELDPTDN